MVESLQLDLPLDGRLDGPARARRWIRGNCRRRGLDNLSDVAALLVSELVTNAVLHAGTDCAVVIELGEHALRVDVVDEDHQHVDATGLLEGSRRGLSIVAAMATSWGVIYRQGGKTVWFTLVSDAPPPTRSTVRQVRHTDQGQLAVV